MEPIGDLNKLRKTLKNEEDEKSKKYYKPRDEGTYKIILTTTKATINQDYRGKDQWHFPNTYIISTPTIPRFNLMKTFIAVEGLVKAIVLQPKKKITPNQTIKFTRYGKGKRTRWAIDKITIPPERISERVEKALEASNKREDEDEYEIDFGNGK